MTSSKMNYPNSSHWKRNSFVLCSSPSISCNSMCSTRCTRRCRVSTLAISISPPMSRKHTRPNGGTSRSRQRHWRLFTSRPLAAVIQVLNSILAVKTNLLPKIRPPLRGVRQMPLNPLLHILPIGQILLLARQLPPREPPSHPGPNHRGHILHP